MPVDLLAYALFVPGGEMGSAAFQQIFRPPAALEDQALLLYLRLKGEGIPRRMDATLSIGLRATAPPAPRVTISACY